LCLERVFNQQKQV